MKSLIAISFCCLCLTHTVLGQEPEHILGPTFLKIIELYLDGQYDKLDSLLRFHGYSKGEVMPVHEVMEVVDSATFTYINKKYCQSQDQGLIFSTKVAGQKGISTPNKEYYIRRVYYSSVCHEEEVEEVEKFLKLYAHNPTIPISEGCVKEDRWMYTSTPDSVKRSGNLYLWQAYFFTMDGKEFSSSFCGLNYRIGCDMHFRRGYTAIDSVGYVSTNEGSNLRMRDRPYLYSNIITNIPDKSRVIIIESSDIIDSVNGQSGYWYKVKYKTRIGWAWGGFIKRNSD